MFARIYHNSVHVLTLQPRHVPFVITSAVVLSGLAILFADWVFSMVLIRYGLASDGFEVLDEEKQWSEL